MKNKLFFVIGLLSLFSIIVPLFTSSPSTHFAFNKTTESGIQTKSTNVQMPNSKGHQALPISDFASNGLTPEVHSAAAIELKNNNIMAFWYGGTREGHKDVAIYKNTWKSTTQQWGNETAILTRDITRDGTARYIRKLGNPVVTRASDNSIWLFYISVSVGGWAGSSINLIKSSDEGQSWSTPKRLISSPFLNLSTLIKGKPIHYSDATMGLPAYHEFLGKFGELLRLDSTGNIIDKIRLSWGKESLQPVIFITSTDHAVAMMRYQGPPPKRILSQTTDDAGLTWTVPKKTRLPNPNAGINGLTLANSKQLLLAFNNDDEEREDITLATSIDKGQTWQVIKAVEENHLPIPDKSKQFAYPWLLQTQNNNIHLLYTWHKSQIKHIVFNTNWLQSERKE